ncbi:MAG: hypothetical protein UY60_C0001G0034 [Parcubacteria group bacterium GW2011_GWB1_50_9]|nr:MAG: hypothetical protein UY60_C0001G0034 [Parcubacteria group bacterium GW2011_GWB1_50_9]
MNYFSFLTFFFFRRRGTTMEFEEFFKANVIDLVGLSDAPEDVKRSFLADASQMVLEAIVDRIDSELPEEKKEEFYRVFRQGAKDEDMQSFIKANIPNFEEIAGEETGRVKDALVKASQEPKSA